MTPTDGHGSVNGSTVVAVRCASYDRSEVQMALNRGMDLLGGAESFVQPGEHILLKPNLLIGRSPERAVTTHPSVFRAAAAAFQSAGAELSYGDSPGFGKPQTAAQRAGLLEVAKELGIELADFSHGETISFPEGRQNKQFTIARGALSADGIVSLPKMKSHGLTRITGAIKNQFGCVPGPLKAEFHARLPMAELFSQMLVDLNRFLKPRLFIMDGIVAMEGNGPQNGTPRPMNVLLLARDPVALDATVCRLVNLDSKLVLPIRYGLEFGLGTSETIEYLGDPIESFVNREFVVNLLQSAPSAEHASLFVLLIRRPSSFVVPDERLLLFMIISVASAVTAARSCVPREQLRWRHHCWED